MKQDDHSDLVRGLPMFAASDPEALAREEQQLDELQGKFFLKRWFGYASKTGPGWMQSALVLGSGSAMGSLFAGAIMGYKLLWVQPLAILMGVIVYAAMSYQTLYTGARPFDAMKKFIHPAMAWAWAIGALIATIIWHLPQYGLAAGMTEDMIKAVSGWAPASQQGRSALLLAIGFVVLIISTAICWSYSSGRKGVRLYEKILKGLVWMIILAFLVVIVFRALQGGIQWGNLFKGFLPLYIPTDFRGVSIVMALYGATTGINATFLFPYSVLARGWSRKHWGLAKFDLITGMLIPFSIVTGLMVIATACTIYNPDKPFEGTMLTPIQAASMFQAAGLNLYVARIVFGLGVIGMVLSTITMQMLTSGFVICEIFGIEPGSWKYRFACLIPAPGMLGVIFWQYLGPWVAIPSSAICGLMLPVAFIGFFLLNNSGKYLKEDKPKGPKAIAWNIAMLVSILITVASICLYLYTGLNTYLQKLNG